ncbi:MAG: galactose-1-epimerase, partial [Marinilabiliales bacterium]|nr:galactose-1-epimerase [Marinilabiliales bacterium]
SSPKKIGADIDALADGYDLNFVLDHAADKLSFAAKLSEANSGRSLSIFTTEPGIQLYTGFYIPEISSSLGQHFGKYAGVALETQHYADSPNRPEFPSTVLRPGECYHSKTLYHFELD